MMATTVRRRPQMFVYCRHKVRTVLYANVLFKLARHFGMVSVVQLGKITSIDRSIDTVIFAHSILDLDLDAYGYRGIHSVCDPRDFGYRATFTTCAARSRGAPTPIRIRPPRSSFPGSPPRRSIVRKPGSGPIWPATPGAPTSRT